MFKNYINYILLSLLIISFTGCIDSSSDDSDEVDSNYDVLSEQNVTVQLRFPNRKTDAIFESLQSSSLDVYYEDGTVYQMNKSMQKVGKNFQVELKNFPIIENHEFDFNIAIRNRNLITALRGNSKFRIRETNTTIIIPVVFTSDVDLTVFKPSVSDSNISLNENNNSQIFINFEIQNPENDNNLTFYINRDQNSSGNFSEINGSFDSNSSVLFLNLILNNENFEQNQTYFHNLIIKNSFDEQIIHNFSVHFINTTSGDDTNTTSGYDTNTTSGDDTNTTSGDDTNTTSGDDTNTTSGDDTNTTSGDDTNTTSGDDINISRADAIKLLRQASFITEEGNITFIQENGFEAWVDYQLNITGDLDSDSDEKYGYLDSTLRLLHQVDDVRYSDAVINDPVNNLEELLDKDRANVFSDMIWWEKAFYNDDQLRQRIAYALSQLLVISKESTVGNALRYRGETTANYYDILVKHSFGNFRNLLSDVAKSSAMAYFLTYIGGKKYDPETGITPDENFARELMQLFTIGLYELNLDGTKKLDGNGNPIPSYTQNDVAELSRVFTGWDLPSSLVKGDKGFAKSYYGSTSSYIHSYLKPLDFTAEYHDFGSKTVLGQTIDANLTGDQDIERALDIIMSNSNIAPHVSRHLITRLVTSNPSPEYLERVATVFNDNGSGVKGDLRAVIKAILLDPEARGENINPNFGKAEEFVVAITHLLHALNMKTYPYFYFYHLDNKSHKVKVYNRFWFSPYGLFFAQEPLNSGTVFNFYSPEYVPSDNFFANNNLVAPEFELRDTDNVIGFSNLFYTLLNYESYRMFKFGLYNPDGFTNIDDYIDDLEPTRQRTRNFYIDLTHIYNQIEMALDGDTNGTFDNLNMTTTGNLRKTSELGKQVIKEHLIDYLDNKLTGGTFSEEFKTELLEHLMTFLSNDKARKIEKIVSYTVRVMATSPEYLILKQ